jgi:hypothetical protein
MSMCDLNDDQLLLRVRDSSPIVPDEVLSAAGATAQRVFARATTEAPSRHGGVPRRPATRWTRQATRWTRQATQWTRQATRWTRQATRWTRPAKRSGRSAFGLLSGVATAIAAIVAVLLISLGGEVSIVQRAYAATSPVGVIVHYEEITASPVTSDRQRVTYWIDGARSRALYDVGNPKDLQDISIGDGELRTLAHGMLVIQPLGRDAARCSPGSALLGVCPGGPGGTPVDGLRELLRSGAMRSSGHTTINGRRLDVLSGMTKGPLGVLRVRALVDARTFVPVRVTIVDALPRGATKTDRQTGIVNTLTITGYERLPINTANRTLLTLPAHPGVRVLRFRACPTKAQPGKLCRSR